MVSNNHILKGKKMFCKECGTEINSNSLECSKCTKTLQLTNSPLSGGEKVSVVIFFLLLALTFIFGIIPIIIVSIGIFIMKNDKKFNPIVKSQKFVTYYLIGLAITTVIVVSNNYYSNQTYWWKIRDYSHSEKMKIIKTAKYKTALVAGSGLLLTPIAVWLLHWLFGVLYFKNLKKHQAWVVNVGIFKSNMDNTSSGISIMGQDKLKTFSVADELIKWNELLDKGLITQEEFYNAKKKLM